MKHANDRPAAHIASLALRVACDELKISRARALRGRAGKPVKARCGAIHLATALGGVPQRDAEKLFGVSRSAVDRAMKTVDRWYTTPAVALLRHLEAVFVRVLKSDEKDRPRLTSADLAHGALMMRSRGITDDRIAERLDLVSAKSVDGLIALASSKAWHLPPTQAELDRMAEHAAVTFGHRPVEAAAI